MTLARVWQLRADVGGGGRDGVVFKITPGAQDGPSSAPRGLSGINIRAISYPSVFRTYLSHCYV